MAQPRSKERSRGPKQKKRAPSRLLGQSRSQRRRLQHRPLNQLAHQGKEPVRLRLRRERRSRRGSRKAARRVALRRRQRHKPNRSPRKKKHSDRNRSWQFARRLLPRTNQMIPPKASVKLPPKMSGRKQSFPFAPKVQSQLEPPRTWLQPHPRFAASRANWVSISTK